MPLQVDGRSGAEFHVIVISAIPTGFMRAAGLVAIRHIHAATAVISRVAADGAAVHGKCAGGRHKHATAETICIISSTISRMCFSAGDGAARAAVVQRQRASYFKDAKFLGSVFGFLVDGMVVQVERHGHVLRNGQIAST